MSDLTDEEPNRFIDNDDDCFPDDIEVRMAAEIKRHRTAQTASEERVRAVVRVALYDGEMSGIQERYDGALDRIATRAAKQLAGAGPSDEDRQALQRVRDHLVGQIARWVGWPREAVVTQELAALDRLLDRSTP